jgi:hypothetical protein
VLFFAARHYAVAERRPEGPARIETDDNHAAFRACELFVRKQAPEPYTVKSFASALVSQDKGGYAVSGVVELRDSAGAVRRRRYSCAVHLDAAAGMVVDSGGWNRLPTAAAHPARAAAPAV